MPEFDISFYFIYFFVYLLVWKGHANDQIGIFLKAVENPENAFQSSWASYFLLFKRKWFWRTAHCLFLLILRWTRFGFSESYMLQQHRWNTTPWLAIMEFSCLRRNRVLFCNEIPGFLPPCLCWWDINFYGCFIKAEFDIRFGGRP